MTAYQGRWRGPVSALARHVALALVALLFAWALPASADDKAQLIATTETGYARLVLTFPDRLDLPAYRMKVENGVLAIEFDEPVSLLLPDVAVTVPQFISVARIDPDRRGIRFGLRTAFSVNRLEAGEKLFLDLLPPSWQGLPPALPEEIVAELAQRAERAARLAEQQQKADDAERLKPTASVRVGRNPTFLRVQFDWTVDTKGEFSFAEDTGTVSFGWPVPVDLYQLKADLPAEVLGASNTVDPDGSHIAIHVAPGTTPRFYELSPRQFIIDIDIARDAGIAAAIAADETARKQREATLKALEEAQLNPNGPAPAAVAPMLVAETPRGPQVVVPRVSNVGNTVRVTFPFDDDTAAAVFRRGDTVWMVFDTGAEIDAPANREALASIASDFTVIPAGETKVVRLDLSSDRLATLGSEGRSWVLSLGDVLLSATEPALPRRERDARGDYSMSVDLVHPGLVHDFRDPIVGDLLRVVTAYPPARGVARDLSYVDFSILRSVHGLVIKGENERLKVAVQGPDALITAPDGLTLSSVENIRALAVNRTPELRTTYMDLNAGREDDPRRFAAREELLLDRTANAEGRLRETTRLELAQFYIANDYAFEAIGVLDLLEEQMQGDELRKKVTLARAIADTLAHRPQDALAILGHAGYAEEADALVWRTLAKGEARDFVGARADAIVADPVLENYPGWLQRRFLLEAARAAVETSDVPMAMRYLDRVDFAKLDPEQVTLYQLLEGRVAEAQGKTQVALDIYGQVIAADIRPTRAEAVYRTLRLLDETGRVDLAKATQTLAAESMLWRGNALEADMQKLLAQFYFRNREYRLGFETVQEAVAYYPENTGITTLLGEAQAVFGDLYLNGRADELEPLDALSLYYDYRQLTPPGSRGDEMIRNLARRLVKFDLLTQAADLLEYQIDARLKGVAQAQIAADLAVIRIADRDPEGALRVLNRTRLADLSPLLDRQRRILEARALIDAGRQELAIDLLSRVTGRDADLLRVEGYWKSAAYGPASELLETLYSPAQHPEPLNQAERMNLVRAAVGFVLANDALALSRLRSKFSEQLAQSEEWAMFDFVTGNVAPTSVEFRKVAREISGLDSLNAFLDSYRKAFAGMNPVTPERAAAANAA